LQNPEPKELRDQNLGSKGVTAWLRAVSSTASAGAMMNEFGMGRKVGCHRRAVENLLGIKTPGGLESWNPTLRKEREGWGTRHGAPIGKFAEERLGQPAVHGLALPFNFCPAPQVFVGGQHRCERVRDLGQRSGRRFAAILEGSARLVACGPIDDEVTVVEIWG